MIETIEEERVKAGLSQRDLCERAKVHPTTYTAIKNGRSGGGLRTIARLRAALDELAAQREAAE